MKRKVLITGAAGGMGQACARLFGATQDLVLTDVAGSTLEPFADELRADGYEIAGAIAGDLGSSALLAALEATLDGVTPLTLIHTAGLSPAQADWRPIMAVNLIATERLLRMIEAHLVPGSVGILIASAAGHLMPPDAEIQPMLDDPLEPAFLDRIGLVIERMAQDSPAGAGGVSYSLSKQAIIRMCERRASPWGALGARIVSISPGMILTPMGRKELAASPETARMFDAAPAGRAGIGMDIALAAQFLASDDASFITGTDLKVDGGWVSVMKGLVSRHG